MTIFWIFFAFGRVFVAPSLAELNIEDWANITDDLRENHKYCWINFIYTQTKEKSSVDIPWNIIPHYNFNQSRIIQTNTSKFCRKSDEKNKTLLWSTTHRNIKYYINIFILSSDYAKKVTDDENKK